MPHFTAKHYIPRKNESPVFRNPKKQLCISSGKPLEQYTGARASVGLRKAGISRRASRHPPAAAALRPAAAAAPGGGTVRQCSLAAAPAPRLPRDSLHRCEGRTPGRRGRQGTGEARLGSPGLGGWSQDSVLLFREVKDLPQAAAGAAVPSAEMSRES